MSLFTRTRSVPKAPAAPRAPSGSPTIASTQALSGQVPSTRTGTAWLAVGAAALIAIVLIIFLAQNTRSTEITFLWMSASTSLAVALLIAAVGSVLLTLILGTARIGQLRRLVHRNRDSQR